MSHELVTLHDAVDNVRNGKTVLGKPSSFSRPTRRRDDEFASPVRVCLAEVLRKGAWHRLDEAGKTTLVWKMLSHAARVDMSPGSPHREMLLMATRYMLSNPKLITGRIGIGGVLRLAKQENAWRSRIEAEEASLRAYIKAQRELRAAMASMPETDMPVLWRGGDGMFALKELVHPRHLLWVGVEMDNCLAKPVPGERRLYEPNPCFWQAIARGMTRVLVMEMKGVMWAVAGIARGKVKQLEFRDMQANMGNPDMAALCLAIATGMDALGFERGEVRHFLPGRQATPRPTRP